MAKGLFDCNWTNLRFGLNLPEIGGGFFSTILSKISFNSFFDILFLEFFIILINPLTKAFVPIFFFAEINLLSK